MVKRLLAKGERVVVFDNLSRGHRQAVRPGAELVEGDLRRPQDLERLFAGRAIECVMHFAALASVGESVRVPELYYDNNLVGCFHLLEAMRAHGARRLIFSSTAATYGEPETVPIDEQHSQIPTNPYGETKRAVEQMLRWYHGAHGLSSISLRYFNAAGADPDGELGEHHEPEEHLIPNVLFAAWPARTGARVRRRLADAGRHLRARLRAHRRPLLGALPGPRAAADATPQRLSTWASATDSRCSKSFGPPKR